MASSLMTSAPLTPERIAILSEMAGDGSTDFRVELWQSELAELLRVAQGNVARPGYTPSE